MISPSPTQRPPEQTTEPEPKKVEYTPRKRAGQSPGALFVKGIFRPIFKGIYYLLRAIRNHKLVTLVMILLILGSAIAANFAVTGGWPFGIGNDQFNFHIRGTNGGGDQVTGTNSHGIILLMVARSRATSNSSLHVSRRQAAVGGRPVGSRRVVGVVGERPVGARAARAQGAPAVEVELLLGRHQPVALLDKNMSQPPDPQQLVNQFSQKNAHLTWKTISVLSAFQESDTTIDSFVEVDLSASGPGGNASGYMIWHFETVSQQGGILVNVSNVDFRPSLQ